MTAKKLATRARRLRPHLAQRALMLRLGCRGLLPVESGAGPRSLPDADPRGR